MPTYELRVVTDQGEVSERTMEADSKINVYEAVEARNELVLSVKEYKEPFDFEAWLNKYRKVKPQEIENFTSQLSVMLESGVPLIACLQALSDQAQSATMEKVMASLVENINAGMSFSQALENFPRVFTPLYSNMIKAGETAGILDEILKRLGNFIRHDIEMTKNIKSAMRYPIIVLSVLSLGFIGAVIFIIPKFEKLFTSKGVDLPLPTKILLGISSFVLDNGVVVLAGIFIGLFALRYYIRTPAGAYQLDYFKIKMPVFKDIILKSAISRFVHMLETLIRGGIQIIKALEITELTVGNLVIAKAIRKVKEQVTEGISLADAMSKYRHFPKMTVKMIAIGEQSGALESMLAHIAQQYDGEVKTKIQRLQSAIEPLITLVMGLFLVVLALGILLPIWNMYSTVQ